MIDKFRETFREEADELLSQLEDVLLELETQPGDSELINAAFRAVHTIKGSAGMFGFEKAGRFTHDLENLLDACRGGLRVVDSRVIDLSLRARDKIRSMLAETDSSGPFDEEARGLMEEFRSAVEDGVRVTPLAVSPPAVTPPAVSSLMVTPPATSGKKTSGEEAADGSKAGLLETFRIVFEPAPDIFIDRKSVV